MWKVAENIVFEKFEELKKGFVNEVGPSFTKWGENEETHKSPHKATYTYPPKNSDEKKILEGTILQTLSGDDGDANKSKKSFPPKV